VHRDLKPANVLLARTPDGFVPKVTDFGLAKLLVSDSNVAHTRSGIAMGTPSYMAPEQIRDARMVDQRADLWSLGCILYELTTRRRAFPGDEALAIYNAVVDGDFIAPREWVADIPERIEQAILGCLRIQVAERIPDCRTLKGVMQGVIDWPLPSSAAASRGVRAPLPSLNSDVPPLNLARRGPNHSTPLPAAERGHFTPTWSSSAVQAAEETVPLPDLLHAP
jgi:serine/threonine protein kinase